MRTGVNTGAEADKTLDVFIRTLKTLEDHERFLREAIAEQAELHREALRRR